MKGYDLGVGCDRIKMYAVRKLIMSSYLKWKALFSSAATRKCMLPAEVLSILEKSIILLILWHFMRRKDLD
jgi:hypothetical protein